MTTSLLVAERFGKLHKNVLQAIERLECSEEFRRLNFQLASYDDALGKPRAFCRMAKDGFAFLVMGFTGVEAGVWKATFSLES
jgi:Rha family phage regulatory protein